MLAKRSIIPHILCNNNTNLSLIKTEYLLKKRNFFSAVIWIYPYTLL